MYNYYPQQQTATTSIRSISNPFPLKGHPVSSLEEAKASSIDFDGTIFFFPDIANKKIYTKQVGLDGIAQLNMYELKPLPAEPSLGDYITRSEFNQTLEALIQKIQPKESEEKPSTYKEVF